MPNDDSRAELCIVGSRLQTLILWGIAGALVFGLPSDQLFWGLPLAAVLAMAGAAVIFRRLEMGADTVSYRRLIGGTAVVPRQQVQATLGHRYLELRFATDENGKTIRPGRIEVPVEIRPQVRDWSEGK